MKRKPSPSSWINTRSYGACSPGSLGVTGKPIERLKALADGIDWILKWQQAEAAKVERPEVKKQAHRRYQDAVLELSKAYALASASDAATEIRDEVWFFQAVRAALVKTTATARCPIRPNQWRWSSFSTRP
ncbi:DUF3387 domain-containing protein [Rhizobium pusense]|uniref:type I restriction enzyme endonuclease domain-containing protein n=1 Tax=Agrobacterium pusense TaxID=648995 RepID=UPI00235675B1|nr:type I restriction enzyme endonuclease domain-containing protein [Agrobacterium pusense]MDH0115641.1 DUF3387 domain-containing protein [Agrobacterium pusense]